ncbi:MAG: diphosphomevalonate decarboxylase [Proteobacteria bacterium]|nr:diphosphomevalonate decarboxylase [Pseudomonadota bacterium]
MTADRPHTPQESADGPPNDPSDRRFSGPHSATARACANIALVKYWGKRDAELNLPAAGSLSLTLDALTTTTSVRFDRDREVDSLRLDGAPAGDRAIRRLSAWLDRVRAIAGIDWPAEVLSENNFPTASGLASSASAYAALAVAASRAAGVELDARGLSILARQGSGSAARSIFGGLVRMHRGERPDGSDAHAEPIVAGHWADRDGPLRMVIAVVGGGAAKEYASRDAMQHCAETSPLYQGWLDAVPADLAAAERAISARDVDALGEIVEANALCMHAAAMASRPAILYWKPATLACIEAVRVMRQSGLSAYCTMDAGPHVKVLTRAQQADGISSQLAAIVGVSRTIISRPGGNAQLR